MNEQAKGNDTAIYLRTFIVLLIPSVVYLAAISSFLWVFDQVPHNPTRLLFSAQILFLSPGVVFSLTFMIALREMAKGWQLIKVIGFGVIGVGAAEFSAMLTNVFFFETDPSLFGWVLTGLVGGFVFGLIFTLSQIDFLRPSFPEGKTSSAILVEFAVFAAILGAVSMPLNVVLARENSFLLFVLTYSTSLFFFGYYLVARKFRFLTYPSEVKVSV